MILSGVTDNWTSTGGGVLSREIVYGHGGYDVDNGNVFDDNALTVAFSAEITSATVVGGNELRLVVANDPGTTLNGNAVFIGNTQVGTYNGRVVGADDVTLFVPLLAGIDAASIDTDALVGETVAIIE